MILVRRETNPDDLGGMVAARGVLTSRGGKTSHAAVVARGMGRTCVVGVEALRVDPRQRTVTTPEGRSFAEGDVISIDGSTGEVFLGEVPVSPSAVTTALNVDADLDADSGDQEDLVASVRRLMTHADSQNGLGVRANADTAADAARARSFGAHGIGLCRTEHMFLGRASQAGRAGHPGPGRRRASYSSAQATSVAAQGLRRHLDRDGWPAGDHPAARPAAARVPARPDGAVGRGGGQRGQGRGRPGRG